MDEIRLSDWPEPPGSTAWLPAYGFAHDMDKDDFFASAAGDTGSTHALYLETIVEETSDDLRSERSSAATWLTDSDADSVIHVTGAPGSECDSGSEREFACPAKRRRRERERDHGDTSPASDDSLSRSSSLAQFESLERSCAANSISPDSLDSASSSDSAPSSPDSAASARTLRAPAARRPSRPHLSAENLSEDSGYSELRATSAPASAARTEIAAGEARAGGGGGVGGSAPCLARAPPSPERTRPPPAARLRAAASVPDDLDLCAEPPRARRHLPHRATFRQSFEVCDSFTVSVADLTALDYRAATAGTGGARPPSRPRLPPPPPPRVAPPPPPAPPPREPSAGSDSTTESERAFTHEMEVTAHRLDEGSRRALLAGGGDVERDLSVLTARRLQDSSWGAWDDVLAELRRRHPPGSPSPTPPRSASPPAAATPRHRRSPRPPSPVDDEPSFSSTPLRCGDARVRSTPELRARPSRRERTDTPDELRASLQEVSPPPPQPSPPPPARSVSSGSKGVTFSPIVAEVSWREVSGSSGSSARSESASDDAADAEVEEVGGGAAPGEGGARARSSAAPAAQRTAAAAMQDAGARPRSRIAGFLSRFANFRFSARKSEKKTRSAGATATATALRAPDVASPPPPPPSAQFVRIPLREPTSRDVRAAAPARLSAHVAVGQVAGGAVAVAHKPPRPARPPAPPPAAGVLETDVDTARTVLHARSLLALAGAEPPDCRPHKSMEFLLDKQNARVVQPPENELQKNSDRVLSEHELRVQRSLQKLNVPEWYKNAPTPREGFLLRKRLSDASAAARWSPAGLNSKTTSLGSLGQPVPPASHHAPQLSPATTSFGRWSTSRLNSNQTSPCSSTRSSVRGGCGGASSPLCSPSARSSFSARQPYLGWRSQERLACTAPRTPHERLASSLLAQSPTSRASEDIQSSIKEVTSAIVHYVSGLEPSEADTDELAPSPRGSQKLYWLESSFVGTKPLESPQTPLVSSLPPPHPRPHRLDLQRPATPAAPAASPAPEWQCSQRSLVGVALTRPSPGSTTLEDVLDSLLGLPSAPALQPSPRRPARPYYLLGGGGEGPRYEPLSSSSLSKTLNQSTPSEDGRTESSARSGSRASDSDARERDDRRSVDSAALAAGRATVDNAAPWSGMAAMLNGATGAATGPAAVRARRPHSAHAAPRRRSEPFAHHARSLDRRTSMHLPPADSRTSLNTDSGDETFVKCRYSKCPARAPPAEAKRHYKSCHNCNYVYCSKECRRAHWEKHRKVCLHSRASALCRQILSTAKEDADSLHRVSALAHENYLASGRGLVKIFFTSPEAAERFTTFGFQHLGEPEYVKWTDLQPTEMGAELYMEVVKLCKSYNPETRLILFVAVCIISEVPTKGAVKWERQLVSRCAKLRLSESVSAAIRRSNAPLSKTKHKKEHRDDRSDIETLVLTWRSEAIGDTKAGREACIDNIQRQLEKRGVVLRRHFPEVYGKLGAFVDGTTERLAPVTIHPKDVHSGRSFVCVIAPDGEVETRGRRVTVVEVAGDQVSTSM